MSYLGMSTTAAHQSIKRDPGGQEKLQKAITASQSRDRMTVEYLAPRFENTRGSVFVISIISHVPGSLSLACGATSSSGVFGNSSPRRRAVMLKLRIGHFIYDAE
jgi:hypothetical protein